MAHRELGAPHELETNFCVLDKLRCYLTFTRAVLYKFSYLQQVNTIWYIYLFIDWGTLCGEVKCREEMKIEEKSLGKRSDAWL